MAIPMSIERNIANPGMEQANVVKFLTRANLNISNSKTIAYQSLYHFLDTYDGGGATTTTAITFFNGAYDAQRTNFPGNSFVLPQSQHFIVTAIQGYTYTGTIADFTNWNQVKGFTTRDQNVANSLGNIGLVNAVYTLTVNGIVVQKDIPLTMMDNTLVSGHRGRFEFSQPIVIPAQSDISLRVRSLAGLSLTADDLESDVQGIGFELIGLGLI